MTEPTAPTVVSPAPVAPSLKVKIILLVVASMFGLLFAECGLRIVGRRAGSGWAGVPPIEDRLAAVTAKSRHRTVALGDSFTEYKDDEGKNWFRFALTDADTDGVNLGQMGTGILHYEKNLIDHVDNLDADLVLVGIYLGNDIQDFEIDLAKTARGIPIPPVTTSSRRTGGFLQSIKSSSRLLSMFAKLIRTRGGESVLDVNLHHAAEIFGIDAEKRDALLQSADADWVQKAKAEQINPWDLAFALIRPSRYADSILLREGTTASDATAAFEQALLRLHGRCVTTTRRCVYVVIPSPPQVDARFGNYLRALGYEVGPELVGDSPLMTRLRTFLVNNEMLHVDVLPALMAEATAEATPDLFLANDTHLNDRGQEVAGAAVRQSLKEFGLLPSKN